MGFKKEMPYGIYPELDFDVPVSYTNDSYGRYKICIQEMRESSKILKQLFSMYKESDTQLNGSCTKLYLSSKRANYDSKLLFNATLCFVTQGMRPPVGEVYVATESPKGELGYFVVSDGSPYAYRMKIRTPSFQHTAILEEF